MFRLVVLFVVCSFVVAEPNCSQPPKKEDMMECCAKKESMKDVGKKCAEKHTPDATGINFCYGECIFNETGLLVNGEYQKAKASAVLGDMYKDFPALLPVATEALAKCEEFAKAKLPKVMAEKPPGIEKCQPLPALISVCFFAETFINCPASLWQNTDNCNQAKEFMKSCQKSSGAA